MFSSSISIHVQKDTKFSHDTDNTRNDYTVLKLDAITNHDLAIFFNEVESIDRAIMQLLAMKNEFVANSAKKSQEELVYKVGEPVNPESRELSDKDMTYICNSIEGCPELTCKECEALTEELYAEYQDRDKVAKKISGMVQ